MLVRALWPQHESRALVLWRTVRSLKWGTVPTCLSRAGALVRVPSSQVEALVRPCRPICSSGVWPLLVRPTIPQHESRALVLWRTVRVLVWALWPQHESRALVLWRTVRSLKWGTVPTCLSRAGALVRVPSSQVEALVPLPSDL